MESDQNATKLCTRLFLHKINKSIFKKTGESKLHFFLNIKKKDKREKKVIRKIAN